MPAGRTAKAHLAIARRSGRLFARVIHRSSAFCVSVVIGALAGGVALDVMYGVDSIPGQLAAAGAVWSALVIIDAI